MYQNLSNIFKSENVDVNQSSELLLLKYKKNFLFYKNK